MLLLSLALMFAASTAQAQNSNEARLRDALRDTGSRLRTAEAALAAQQAATAAAERERDALKAQSGKPAAREDGARLAALQRQLGQSAAASDEARANAQKWQAAQQQAAQLAQQKETERLVLAKRLDDVQAQSARCASGNQALYDTGRELAGLYRDPDFIDFVRDRGFEPFGLDRVKHENRVRTLEDKLDRQHDELAQCAGDAGARSVGAAVVDSAVTDSTLTDSAATAGG